MYGRGIFLAQKGLGKCVLDVLTKARSQPTIILYPLSRVFPVFLPDRAKKESKQRAGYR